jgi:hypothetical protein
MKNKPAFTKTVKDLVDYELRIEIDIKKGRTIYVGGTHAADFISKYSEVGLNSYTNSALIVYEAVHPSFGITSGKYAVISYHIITLTLTLTL